MATARKVYHVVPWPGGWAVKEPRVSKPLSTHARKVDAVAEARRLGQAAGRAQIVIHGRQGQILEDITIGGDPIRRRGRWPTQWAAFSPGTQTTSETRSVKVGIAAPLVALRPSESGHLTGGTDVPRMYGYGA